MQPVAARPHRGELINVADQDEPARRRQHLEEVADRADAGDVRRYTWSFCRTVWPRDSSGGTVARPQRIAQVARTGQPGDGKVFILALEAALRIATGETGEDALR